MDWGFFVLLVALLAICVSPAQSELSEACVASQSVLSACLLVIRGSYLSFFVCRVSQRLPARRHVLEIRGLRLISDRLLLFALCVVCGGFTQHWIHDFGEYASCSCLIAVSFSLLPSLQLRWLHHIGLRRLLLCEYEDEGRRARSPHGCVSSRISRYFLFRSSTRLYCVTLGGCLAKGCANNDDAPVMFRAYMVHVFPTLASKITITDADCGDHSTQWDALPLCVLALWCLIICACLAGTVMRCIAGLRLFFSSLLHSLCRWLCFLTIRFHFSIKSNPRYNRNACIWQ